ASVGWGLGGEVRHDVCRLDRIDLGGPVSTVAAAADAEPPKLVSVARPICALSQDKSGALAPRGYDGLIGGALLSRFRVIFDGTRHRMILEPGPRVADAFEFDMSGPALSGDAGRGVLKAMRVRENTPASEAGIHEGDQILAVDGKAVTGADRDDVRELF